MFDINVDLSDLDDILKVDTGLKKITDEAAEDLSKIIVSRAKELAAQKLKSRKEMYQGGLSYEKVGEDTWFVKLDAKVRWIDDGQPAFDMLKGLLASGKTKRDKDGHRYIVVPFDKSPASPAGPGRGPASSTSAQNDLVSAVKKELKSRGIPFGKHEIDAQGNKLTGKLHSFSIPNSPVKKDQGPGQRRGPVGEVMQGNTGIPFLQNVSIYQTKGKNGKTQRSILTFRVASDRHAGEAKWEHPGNAPVEILEEATKQGLEMWVNEIAPAIIDKVVNDL